ncbi:hypothetical protein BDR06DRAFT_957015 [Suillus hirtellus]|nr:hypothetical protein BDR06DRAFT_957015 [Suillus hirtellus]
MKVPISAKRVESNGEQNAPKSPALRAKPRDFLRTGWWTVCKDTGDVAGTCCGAAVDDLNTERHREVGGHERWGAA